ncbi:hypothetical protein [Candidatus Pelagibacter sp. HIMB1509]|uniref:hypothetical protein n=1 Tax=Candidatus Pelagibacter sp. HIMB1509 TaxID=3413339 RepID=UPI003F85E34E
MITKFFRKVFLILKIIVNKNFYYKIAKSQNHNKENIFLKKISKKLKNKSFIEIGFHHLEFNSIGLIENNFSGVLIDGGRKINCLIMKLIIFIINKNVKVKNYFITKENLTKIINKKKIGCISIDIDGNDYWIIKELLNSKIFPEIFVVEYNASFLNLPITIPYKKKFDRFKFDKTGFYHGASLKAFIKLFKKFDFKLVKTIDGVNAIFVNSKFSNLKYLKEITFTDAYKEGVLRNKWSRSRAKDQYKLIKNLPLKYV